MKSEKDVKAWLKMLKEQVDHAKSISPSIDKDSEELAILIAKVQQALVLIYALEWVLDDEEQITN